MTTPPVVLVPLVCPQCRQPIPAEPGEVAWVCGNCRAGSLLGADSQVRPLDVFYAADLRPGFKGRPFWATLGKVKLGERQTYKGNNAREAEGFWAGPRLFLIPAYTLSLEELVAAGMHMLRQGSVPQMSTGAGAPFLPVTTPPEDLMPLAEFIVLAIEADRRDALKSVNFSLQLEPAQLWVLT